MKDWQKDVVSLLLFLVSSMPIFLENIPFRNWDLAKLVKGQVILLSLKNLYLNALCNSS